MCLVLDKCCCYSLRTGAIIAIIYDVIDFIGRLAYSIYVYTTDGIVRTQSRSDKFYIYITCNPPS